MATEGVSSLYERLGGVYSIATVIDDFIDRIMVDPRLNVNPRESATVASELLRLFASICKSRNSG
jgi:truncated hemoglobin YjbI